MNSCLTCKWAEWTMTNHRSPRVHKSKSGKCVYPMTRVALPASFRLSYAAVSITAEHLERQKHSIWPDRPETNCRVWENANAAARGSEQD